MFVVIVAVCVLSYKERPKSKENVKKIIKLVFQSSSCLRCLERLRISRLTQKSGFLSKKACTPE